MSQQGQDRKLCESEVQTVDTLRQRPQEDCDPVTVEVVLGPLHATVEPSAVKAKDRRPFVHLVSRVVLFLLNPGQLADLSASLLELRLLEDAGTYSSTDRQQIMTVCWRIPIAQAR